MIQRDGCDRRQVEPLIVTNLVYCILLLYTRQVSALADFSGYLTKLLQNHTVFACDGEHLILQCPRHSTKVLDECQNLRSCQVLVNSRVFGPDPCPGISKYLLVSYKCKPSK
ncbi:eva-1 homolog C [Pelobates cultripes]|uniref:Eva-1 homolog C n=1 Tax=Pelobates cultripes TaxID=61616 RepID=A0AAD1VJH2_PELCU|nr:eva-1 homolog C [Pelobates cultripes]